MRYVGGTGRFFSKMSDGRVNIYSAKYHTAQFEDGSQNSTIIVASNLAAIRWKAATRSQLVCVILAGSGGALL